jgi:hypothetical protein
LCPVGGGSTASLDLQQFSYRFDVVPEPGVAAAADQQGLDVGATAGTDRIELSDDPSSADDCEVLAAMLYGIEDVGEIPSCVGGANLGHRIRLSDMLRSERPRIRHIPGTRDGALNRR